MNKIVTNRWLDAFLKLLLISAVIHFSIMVLALLINQNTLLLNFFDIIDLDLFLPGIINGTTNQILSAIVIIFLYIIIYLFFTKKSSAH